MTALRSGSNTFSGTSLPRTGLCSSQDLSSLSECPWPILQEHAFVFGNDPYPEEAYTGTRYIDLVDLMRDRAELKTNGSSRWSAAMRRKTPAAYIPATEVVSTSLLLPEFSS